MKIESSLLLVFILVREKIQLLHKDKLIHLIVGLLVSVAFWGLLIQGFGWRGTTYLSITFVLAILFYVGQQTKELWSLYCSATKNNEAEVIWFGYDGNNLYARYAKRWLKVKVGNPKTRMIVIIPHQTIACLYNQRNNPSLYFEGVYLVDIEEGTELYTFPKSENYHSLSTIKFPPLKYSFHF